MGRLLLLLRVREEKMTLTSPSGTCFLGLTLLCILVAREVRLETLPCTVPSGGDRNQRLSLGT